MEDPQLEAADFDIDFGVTESGRTMVLGKYAGDDGTFDDMEFSITPTTAGNVQSERSMGTIGTIGTIGDSTVGSISSSIMDSTRSAAIKEEEQSLQTQSHGQNATSGDQQTFQPLVPLPEHNQRQRSAPRAIPSSDSQTTPSALGHPQSQASSAGSSGSAFLNNILNPAGATFNNTQMSHTPPTHISTSYEASHFGKRARSGVSYELIPT